MLLFAGQTIDKPKSTNRRLVKYPSGTIKITDAQREVLRPGLLNGLHGLYCLAYNGYRSRNRYGNLIEIIGNIQKLLREETVQYFSPPLIKTYYKQWYNFTPTGVVFLEQKKYVARDDILGDGICFGIVADWCRRWTLKQKTSWLSSSKAQDPFLSIPQYEDNLKEKLIKKGKLMVLPQQAQARIKKDGEGLIDVARSIRKLENDLVRLQSYIPGGRDYQNQINIRDQRVREIRDAITYSNGSPVADPELRQVLSKLSRKYEGLKSRVLARYVCDENITAFLSDYTDFKRLLAGVFRTLLKDVVESEARNEYASYAVLYSPEETYLNVRSTGGHAMGIHVHTKDDGFKHFAAMDPNWGEFHGGSVDDCINILCTWLAYYSISEPIKVVTLLRYSEKPRP